MPNSPANDHWELKLSTTTIGALNENDAYITFLSNGSIDMTRTLQSDIDHVNSLLSPAISSLRVQLSQTPFDFWELINWLFVSYYWTVLSDLGQINPTIYPTTFDAPATLPPTNNIFINQTLFDIYTSYLQNTVLPLLNNSQIIQSLPPLPQFMNLSNNNSLQRVNSAFIRDYPCLQRQRKPWLNFIISVIAADYAMFMTLYKIAMILGERFQKWRQGDDESDGELPINYRENTNIRKLLQMYSTRENPGAWALFKNWKWSVVSCSIC
jgi:hypothetical protein